MKGSSPQLENGYTRIANELIEALAQTTLSQNESKCLWVVIRKTYGFQRKTAKISYGNIAKMTKVLRQNVFRSMKSLEKRKIIIRIQNIVGLNKYHHQWIKSLKSTDCTR